tara:strand:+ start:1429 stop:1662 length:234 start_codon:yes stop_codon:yes gene_type:complete
MTTKWIVKEKGVILIDYKRRPVYDGTGIINHYNEMIKNAKINIGQHTNNNVLITDRFVEKLEERRDELIVSLYRKEG